MIIIKIILVGVAFFGALTLGGMLLEKFYKKTEIKDEKNNKRN